MTLVDPTASSRRSSRRSSSAPAATATSGLRLLWSVAWLVVVPLLVALMVDQQAGAAMGTIPGGPNIAAVAALVAAVLACAGLRWIRADLWLGLLPLVAAVVGRFGFTQPAWVGLVIGLVIGGIAFTFRRRGR